MVDLKNLAKEESRSRREEHSFHRPRGPRASTPKPSLLVYGLLLTGAAAAIFLAAGPPQGGLGIFLLCAGVALVTCPPQTRVDGRLWGAAGLFLACSALAFLPANWFAVPAWRKTLQAAPAISLPPSVSTVPWETGFWLAVLAISALTGLFMLAQPIRSKALLTLTVGAAVICGVYAALAICAKLSGWHPFGSEADFGFFPNRNHTATFLITGSILAMGVLGVILPERLWVFTTLAAASLAICVVALLFFSVSRGGVVFLLMGALLWIAGLGLRHWRAQAMVSLSVLTVSGIAVFWIYGSQALDRLFHTVKLPPTAQTSTGRQPSGDGSADRSPREAQDTPFDFRVLIYRDTLDLIRDFPITGTGLGAFGRDFAHYRKASLSESATIHPESDWLMLTAEAGVPALLCLCGLSWLLVRRLPALRDHPFWPLRWGCVAAVGAAVLHGCVDVPAHRIALGWWILIIGGLGFQISREPNGKRSRLQHGLFVLAGLGSLILGTQLVRAEWFGGNPLPPFVAGKAQDDILAAFNRQDMEGAVHMAREAVKVSPMSAPLYYQLGALLLRFEDTDAEVERLFEVQRLLVPDWPAVPFKQGESWLAIDAKQTVPRWLDAFERRRRIDLARGTASTGTVAYYQDLLRRAKQFPDVQRGLAALASQGPAYALAWMNAADAEIIQAHLVQITSNESLLRSFSEAERQQFLRDWHAKGDRAALLRFVGEHADWRAAALALHQPVD